MNDERIEFEKKILKLKSLTPIQKSRLELMMRILFVINVIGNSYFVTKYFYYHKHGPDSINNKFFEDDQKISWYSIFLGLVFCVMGCFFCHRLSVFQQEYFSENKCKIISAIIGLALPLLIRGVYGIVIPYLFET